jgi:hypothetical protein
MSVHNSPSIFAGKRIQLTEKAFHDLGSNEKYIYIEDWWDRVYGESWMHICGNPACLGYAIRSAKVKLPIDDEVLYGKIGIFGYIVHETELLPIQEIKEIPVRNQVRGSGKTFRMMQSIINCCEIDNQVSVIYVFGADCNSARRLASEFRNLYSDKVEFKDNNPTIFEYQGKSIRFVSIMHNQPDNSTGLILGAYPGTKSFADHFTLETHFGWILDQYELYGKGG